MTGAVTQASSTTVASPSTDVRVMPLVRWALYASIFLIPLEYPNRFIFEVTTIAGALFLLTTLLQPGACYGRVPWAMGAFGLYFCFELLAFVTQGSPYPGGLFLDAVAKSSLMFLLWLLFGWVCSNLFRQESIYRHALRALVLGCLVRAALPLLGIGRTAAPQGTGGERVTALGQNANQSAHVLAIGLLALIGIAYVQPQGAPRLRVLGWGAVGLVALGLVQTGSRGGLVVFCIGLLVYLSTGRTLRTRIRNVGVGLAGFAAIFVLVANNEAMMDRIAKAQRGSLSQRENIFPAQFAMIRDKPLLGWGPITNKYELASRLGDPTHDKRDAHNILLEVLTASGLLGTIPFCIGLWLCFRSAWFARAGPRGVIPLALLLAVLAGNMAENRIAGPLLWLVLGCALASGAGAPPGWSMAVPIAPRDPVSGHRGGRLLSRRAAQA